MTILSKDWGRKLKLASVPLIIAGVAACATPFRADVQRFQSQLPAPQGQTFAVVADDPALAGGLEFAQYADLVEAQMARLGYTPAGSGGADLIVRFDYGVGDGRERVRSRPGFHDPFYSPWYGYRPVYFRDDDGDVDVAYVPYRNWGFGWRNRYFDRDVYSYTIYTSGIEIEIDRASNGERLFEGEAKAVSTSNNLQYLVPNLVEAMFTGFPGNSGETVRISIKPEGETTVRRID